VSLALLEKGTCVIPINSRLDLSNNLKRTMEIFKVKEAEIAPAIVEMITKLHELV
jgi:hypothetical protein